MTLSLDQINHPLNKAIIGANGSQFRSRIDDTGATRSNADWINGVAGETLNIEGQRVCFDLVCAGIALQDEDLKRRGLNAVLWGLREDVAGPLGDWPRLREGDTGNQTHPKSVFLCAAARAVNVLSASGGLTEAMRQDIKTAKAGLYKSMVYLNGSEACAEFVTNKNTMNQRFFLAASLRMIGVWFSDKPLNKKAESIMDDAALSRMWPDGTLPEAYGYDWSYQTVSLRLIVCYLATFVDGAKPMPSHILSMLTKATEKWMSGVSPEGLVDTQGSRTTLQRYVPGTEPKGAEIDIYGLSARFVNLILNRADLEATAKALLLSGPDFEHS